MSNSFNVPQTVRAAAKRGLALRKEHGRGGFSAKQAASAGVGSGVQRASNLIQGSVSYETVKRMLAFFNRHKAYKKHHKDRTSAAYISWLLWGGDAGYSWARRIVKQEEQVKKGTLLALTLFGDDYPEEEDETSVTSFTALLKAVKRDPLDFDDGDLIPAAEGEQAEPSNLPPLKTPKGTTSAEDAPLSEKEVDEYLEDLDKAVVVIDLVDPEEREEEDTLPAPPVPPPIIDPHIPEVRIAPVEHIAIKRTAKAARKSPGADQQAKKQGLYIMRGQWANVDIDLVQSYLSFIDDSTGRINALCVGGEVMLECIEKAEPKVPTKYLEGFTGEARERRKQELQDYTTLREKGAKTSFAAKVRDEVTKPGEQEFLRSAAKVSGISQSILNEVHDRGSTSSKPGASSEVWSRARVYSFCTGGKTRRTTDKDLWSKHNEST